MLGVGVFDGRMLTSSASTADFSVEGSSPAVCGRRGAGELSSPLPLSEWTMCGPMLYEH